MSDAFEFSSETFVLRLAYEGTHFSGFAEQCSQRTVAGTVRTALETFLRRPVEFVCAGRTDAGVHARAQYISFSADPDELVIPRARWMGAMAALLPEDVALREVYRAPAGFSARFDARARRYRYCIATGQCPPVLTRHFAWWHRRQLDMDAMQQAATYLIGEHDFKSFCKASSAEGKRTCRHVYSCHFERCSEFTEPLLTFEIEGNAFLHSMVRSIVGSLVEVGLHHREPTWMLEVRAARERGKAGPTAPARGLCFMDVTYDEDVLTLCS